MFPSEVRAVGVPEPSGLIVKMSPPRLKAILEPLTPREAEVLRLLALGLTNREIAREMMFSVSTVKNHIQHIITKLDASDRTQAAVRAVELELIDPEG